MRCWTGLNHNWFKSYDTKHKWGGKVAVLITQVFFRLSVSIYSLTKVHIGNVSRDSTVYWSVIWTTWGQKLRNTYIVETNLVKIVDPPSKIFSPHCESRFDCKRNHCSSKTAVNRSVSLQFVYFSLSESLVNYGLESDLCVCCYLIQIAKKTYFSTPIQNNSGYMSTMSDGRKPNPQF